ncbi:hypothetical protein [Mesonia aestuariivivens]|uniref:Uncharacterized protein n=1 Tax=Mesonia aestuariivivens TaxID=2796128 RepID=A0ABS6VZQ5_9FLAO|nr:hypothetical protein [Mesonia aestuariivivens]MBW2960782.1 hypothetical protein [Mesonia aestuariivivens]
MLTFFIILGVLLIINILLFIFSRNKVEDKKKSAPKRVIYNPTVNASNVATTPQFQDA